MNYWLLLRGLGRDARHWGDFPRQLRDALGEGEAEVLTMDLPGNGQRNDEPSPASVAAMVDDCRSRLAPKLCGEPLQLLALSLGGMVALDWLCRHPDEIARCVLINTSLGGVNPVYQRLRPRQYWRLLRLLLGAAPESAEALILAMTSNRPDKQLLAEWVTYHRERPVERGNLLRQLQAAARFRAPTVMPPTPVLLLASEHDQLVDVACSRRLSRRYHWPLIVHGSAGHDLPLDDGPWLAAQVRRWCQPGE